MTSLAEARATFAIRFSVFAAFIVFVMPSSYGRLTILSAMI
jgi:hypothetical protein